MYRYRKCIECEEEFSEDNTHTPDGWLETQVSGMCEDCYEGLFESDDEDFDED